MSVEKSKRIVRKGTSEQSTSPLMRMD